MKIAIDFQGGAHGNYLEFVCNKFLAGIACNDMPFNQHGASHIKRYEKNKIFEAGHYSFKNGLPAGVENVIAVMITTDDLLNLWAVSLLRAGDYGYDNQSLEINTYHKLNNDIYRSMLETLTGSFFQGQIQKSYQCIRDSAWPDVNTIEEYEALPDWIKRECLEIHNFSPRVLDYDHPHCPRSVLREFFKLAFHKPDGSGFMVQQKKMLYPDGTKVFYFPFSCFYDTEEFLNTMRFLSTFFDYSLIDLPKLRELHSEFLQRQPYKDHKTKTDQLFDAITSGHSFDIHGLDLIQEAYLEAKFEIKYGKETRIADAWFLTSDEIRKYFAG